MLDLRERSSGGPARRGRRAAAKRIGVASASPGRRVAPSLPRASRTTAAAAGPLLRSGRVSVRISTPRAVCTIASANYLAQVRTLAASLRAVHPELPLFVLLCDRVADRVDASAEGFELTLAEELPNLPAVAPLFFKYDVLELNTALKPFFLEHLLERHGIERLLFLDPDCWVTGPLTGAFDALDGCSIALTPHLLEPIRDRARPSELDILRAGVFNLGFLGLRAGASATTLLGWWKARLYERGEMSPERGVHVDQRWMDLAPQFFPGTRALDDPALNVGYWNLHERAGRLHQRNGRWMMGEAPLAFFHFSGFDPRDPGCVSRYQDRHRLADLPALAPLFLGYARALREHGWERCQALPYAYRDFDRGIRIPPAARRAYRELGEAAARFGDPFRTTGGHGFFAWLTEVVTDAAADDAPGLTRLHLTIWQGRPDLQRIFPRPWSDDRRAFARWLCERAEQECDLDPLLLPRRSRESPSPGGASAQRARRAVARTVLRFGAPLESRIVETLGRRSVALERARAWKRRIESETTPADVDAAHRAPRARRGVVTPLGFGVDALGEGDEPFRVAGWVTASAAALAAAGVPHTVVDVTCGNVVCEERFGINLVHADPAGVAALRTRLDPGFFLGRRNIGLWTWEVAPFPECWPDAHRSFDEIWVGSRHAQSLLSRALPIPVVHVPPPLYVATHVDSSGARARFGIPEGAFAYLSCFEACAGFERRNPIGAVHAFQQAFRAGEAAALVLVTVASEDGAANLAALREAIADDSRIVLIDRRLAREEMLGLCAACDAFLSLHRAVGLGRSMAEALSFGKPVIATGYSGNLDFMTPSNSFLIVNEEVTLGEPRGAFGTGTRWAEPDLAHAAELARMVFRYRDLGAARGARGARDLAARHGASDCGRAMLDRLHRLAPDLVVRERE